MNPRLRRHSGLSIVVAGTIAAASLVTTGGALAGPPPAPYVELEPGQKCLSAYQLTKGATVTLTLKRSGSVVTKSSFKATGDFARRCLAAAPKGDDTLVIKQVKNSATLSNRSLLVPKLTVKLDGATNVLSVHGERSGVPMDGEEVLQGPFYSIGGRFMFGMANTIAFDSNGDASQDWTAAFDVTHGYSAYAIWSSPDFDAVSVYAGLPMVAVRAGKALVNGVGKPGTKTTITLKTSGGALRAKATATTIVDRRDPVFTGTFKSGSTTVKAKVGDKVTSSRLSGSWTVLANTLQVTPGDGTGSVSVTCLENVSAAIWVDGGNVWSDVYPTGVVAMSGLTIESGTKVEIACQDANGFAQWFTKVVP